MRAISDEFRRRAENALDLLGDPLTRIELLVGEHPGIRVFTSLTSTRQPGGSVSYAVRGRRADAVGDFEAALDLALLAGTLLGDDRSGIAAPTLDGGVARAALAIERESGRLLEVGGDNAAIGSPHGGALVDLGLILRDPRRRGQAIALPPYRGPGSAPGLSELGERLARIAAD